MDNQGKFKDDYLNHFINSEMVEKAPEGFTSKVMSRVQLERVPSGSASLWKRNLVPIVSAAVTIILILSEFIFQGVNSSPIIDTEYLKQIKLSFPEIDLKSIFSFNLPSVVIYVFIGILILSVLDKALKGVFHKESKI